MAKKTAEEVLEKLGGGDDHPYQIGQNYYFLTLTFHYTGKLLRVLEKELVITDAAFIPESARWSETIAKGTLNEVEPFPDGVPFSIPRDGTAACPISWPLPRKTK